MNNYFNLCVKIYVATNDFDRVVEIKPEGVRDWEQIKIGVGYQGSLSDGPQKTYEVYEVGDDNTFRYLIPDPDDIEDIANSGIFITYTRNRPFNHPFTTNLWSVYEHNREYYQDGKYKITCNMRDILTASEGMVEFTCADFQDYHDSYLSEIDPDVCPFHGVNIYAEEDSIKYLCFNSNETTPEGADEKKNGADWECWIYIIDPNNPRFQEDIETKTLQLPSVYCPFYMRLLALIDNKRTLTSLTPLTRREYFYPTNVYGNIYNGIGCFNKNSVYEVCDFTAKIDNKIDKNIALCKVTGETPTLLCENYVDTVHTLDTLSFTPSNIEIGFKKEAQKKVTSLTDLNFIFTAKEKTPEGYYIDDVFRVNTLEYTNKVSFYEINFTTGLTNENKFTIKFNNNSFKGTSSENIKYFLVSKYFYNSFLDRIDFTCNTAQAKELNPQGGTNNGTFLSLYGGKFYPNYDDYMNGGQVDPADARNCVFKMILLDPSDYATAYSGIEYVFDHYDLSEDGKWGVIGITDPLVDLLSDSQEMFLREKNEGNILIPHTDFVTIMTFKK